MFCRNVFSVSKTFFFYLSYRLKTNILYSPLSFNQFKLTVLSDHACIYFILNLLRLHFKYPTKFEDTCVAISSSRDIDEFFLANQYLLVIRLWLTCSVDKLLCKRQWILHLYWHHWKVNIDFSYWFIFNGDGSRYLYLCFQACNPF